MLFEEDNIENLFIIFFLIVYILFIFTIIDTLSDAGWELYRNRSISNDTLVNILLVLIVILIICWILYR